jgi:hypothetical protein
MSPIAGMDIAARTWVGCARLGHLRPCAGIGWLVAALSTGIGPLIGDIITQDVAWQWMF